MGAYIAVLNGGSPYYGVFVYGFGWFFIVPLYLYFPVYYAFTVAIGFYNWHKLFPLISKYGLLYLIFISWQIDLLNNNCDGLILAVFLWAWTQKSNNFWVGVILGLACFKITIIEFLPVLYLEI